MEHVGTGKIRKWIDVSIHIGGCCTYQSAVLPK